jgi:hypothetical protein
MTDLPKSKYSDPIHTPGREFELNGKEYVGWYVVTYLDTYFTGKTLTKDSKEIFKIQTELPFKNNVFVQQVVSPSISERVKGIWKRYIIQKTVSQAIIEVNKERYVSFNTTPGIRKAILDWVIKGPVNDVTKGNYRYVGAENKNKETVSKLESTIPGISNFFKNYSEFVE